MRIEPGAILEAARRALFDCFGEAPPVAIVLGSGLATFTDGLQGEGSVPFQEIPGFIVPTVGGHQGELQACRIAGRRVLVMKGRLHLYEGFSAREVALPVSALANWGISTFFLTNAAGAINQAFAPGDLMAVTDHLNLLGDNPLAGPLPCGGQERFLEMSEAYSPMLVSAAIEVASRLKLRLHSGIYAGVRGPSFETPAEVRMLRALGADAVGMSTIPEVIALRHFKRELMAISTISNMACGISNRPISHAEVLESGKAAGRKLAILLTALLERVGNGELRK